MTDGRRRVAVLVNDRFGPLTSKTAMAVIRYGSDEVVTAIDRSKRPVDASEYIGPPGKGIPVVDNIGDALRMDLDAVIFGWAPEGGALPDHDRRDLLVALESGVDVISGLHDHLGDDPMMRGAAERGGATITDLRRPPDRKLLFTGEVAYKRTPVVLVTGTDCSTGKMTVAVEIVREAQDRGIDAAFVATGQSGMLLSPDAGAPIDALVGDFMAGEVEALVLEADERRPDLIVVEGQGALSHPAYGAVALAIHQGCFPDALVMCHDPNRTHYKAFSGMRHKPVIPPLGGEIALAERVLLNTSMGEVVAVALMAAGASHKEMTKYEHIVRDTLGLVAADVFQDGPGPFLDAVVGPLRIRGGGGG
ncbi:MAG: DUF1611 domain-containing protein [Thermoplasmata archaeon]|nr:MAG: DUF1611 domain-containing protein [Thermoplasmata archaeon]